MRAQARAVYSPINIGHFGLNLPIYTHFTSPIRRYADLVVHRCIVHILEEEQEGIDPATSLLYPTTYLARLAEHLQGCEHTATQVSREVEKWFLLRYFNDNHPDVCQGVISGMNASGLFVRLIEYGIDGHVTKESLGGHHFIFDKENYRYYDNKRKIEYQVGDAVNVEVNITNNDHGHLWFRLLFRLITNKPNSEKYKKGV